MEFYQVLNTLDIREFKNAHRERDNRETVQSGTLPRATIDF